MCGRLARKRKTRKEGILTLGGGNEKGREGTGEKFGTQGEATTRKKKN